jgi:hypothetical protein
MSKTTPTTIRLSITKEVRSALNIAKKRYPALSDPEILKLGLSQIATGSNEDIVVTAEREAIRLNAAHAVGTSYLQDSEEDVYSATTGKRVHFL